MYNALRKKSSGYIEEVADIFSINSANSQRNNPGGQTALISVKRTVQCRADISFRNLSRSDVRSPQQTPRALTDSSQAANYNGRGCRMMPCAHLCAVSLTAHLSYSMIVTGYTHMGQGMRLSR